MTTPLKLTDASVLNASPSDHDDNGSDRRRWPRVPIDRPCRVLREGRIASDPGRTINHAPGGLLVEIRTSRPPRAGELIAMAVDWPEVGLVHAEEADRARVVRTDIDPDSDRVLVAVELADAEPVPAEALPTAA